MAKTDERGDKTSAASKALTTAHDATAVDCNVNDSALSNAAVEATASDPPGGPHSLMSAGSIWIWSIDGKDWPVMLCNDDQVPELFLQYRKDPREIPAFQLGRHKYIWVLKDDRLRQYDPSHDYLADSPPSNTSSSPKGSEPRSQKERNRMHKEAEQRELAFKRDAMNFDAKPEYWKNYVESAKEARRLEREIAASDPSSRSRSYDHQDHTKALNPRKRQRTSETHSTSSNQARKQLLTPGPTPIKTRSALGASRDAPIDVDEGFNEDSDSETMFVSETRRVEDPFSARTHDKSKTPIKHRQERQSSSSSPPDIAVCTIIIGKIAFRVPKNAIGPSDLLSDRVAWDDELGSHLNITDITQVTPQLFGPVWEFMQNGDFGPLLIEKPGRPARVEGVLLQEDKDKAAEKCAYVFSTASQLQLVKLQELALAKLKALYPLSTLYLLIVTTICQKSAQSGADVEDELLEWLVDHIAEYHLKLTAEHGQMFARVLESSEDLRTRVYDKLAANPDIGARGLDD